MNLFKQVLVQPSCGRLVSFTSGFENLHRVARVTHGTRYVLAMWFTCSEKHKNQDFDDDDSGEDENYAEGHLLGSSSRVNDRSARIEGDGHSLLRRWTAFSTKSWAQETISCLTALASSFGWLGGAEDRNSPRKEINKPEIPQAQAQ